MTKPRTKAQAERTRLHAVEAGAEVRVAIYLRISTDEEHQPFSLEAQEHRLRAFIESQPGWCLARPPYVDQMSGAYLERPQLQKALRDSALGLYDVLLVYRVDRFARKLSVLVELLEQLDSAGVAFRSATEPIDTSTATGRMLVQLLGVFAEFERATIIDRVVAGMERKAARGEWTAGRYPFGYTTPQRTKGDDSPNYLVVDESRAPLVPVIFDLYARKRMGAHATASWLNDNGHRTRRGALWSHTAVLDVLRNRAYLGEVYFRGSWHIAPHPPLIDADLFAKASHLLIERGEDYSRRAANVSDYLLSGLVTCAKCGRHYTGTSAHGRSATYRYYTCFSRQRYGTKTCDADRLPADALDAVVLDSLLATYQRHNCSTKRSRPPPPTPTTTASCTPTSSPPSTPRSPTPSRPSNGIYVPSRKAPCPKRSADRVCASSASNSSNFAPDATTSLKRSTPSQPNPRLKPCWRNCAPASKKRSRPGPARNAKSCCKRLSTKSASAAGTTSSRSSGCPKPTRPRFAPCQVWWAQQDSNL